MTVQLATHRGRIYLRTLIYDADLVDDLRFRFPLRRRGWDPDRRAWWVDQREGDTLLRLLAWRAADVRHVDITHFDGNKQNVSEAK